MNASERILSTVERIKKDAAKAEKTFDEKAKEIERKSNKSIDLFGGTATSQVVEIAAMVREACDGLYASYQTLVGILDEECRPLLAEDADTHAVKEALELIKWLNSESAVGTNFTGSFNGANLGDLVSVKYIPRMENKMIQSYWESKYAEMPGTAEEDEAYRKKQQAERTAKREAARREREAECERQYQEMERTWAKEAKEKEARLARHAECADEIKDLRGHYQSARNMLAASVWAYAYVKSDGTVDGKYDCYSNPKQLNLPAFKGIKSLACTSDGVVGLKYDGTCVYFNNNTNAKLSDVAQWSNIVAIVGGDHHVVGLREDGTCVATSIKNNVGFGEYGVTKVGGWTDIVAVACSDWCTLGLKKNGKIVTAGDESFARPIKTAVSRWKDIEMMAAGGDGVVAINKKGEILTAGKINAEAMLVAENVIQLEVAQGTAYALQADGKVLGGIPYKYDDERTIIAEKNVIAMAGGHGLLLLKKDGTLYRQEVRLHGKSASLGLRLFQNYEERAQANALVEQEEKQRAAYKAANLCQHCGGEFKKALFGSKCAKCGLKKDY